MKSLLALFAVTAVMGVAAVAAPASAATGDAKIKWSCDFTQDREDQKNCVCVAEVRQNKLVDGRLVWISSWRPATCPANGGGGGSSASSDDDTPTKHHSKTISKASSSSSLISLGTVVHGVPFAITLQGQHNSAFTTGDGQAGADAGTGGGASASASNHSSQASSGGGTGGSSCVGSGCNSYNNAP